jgi:DNA-directed RNA polymerase specialized sigma24 family protein
MSCLQRNEIGVDKANLYATREDFCGIFSEELDSLYQLSFAMTGNHEKAEQSFVAALGECIHSSHVLREGAHSWAKRAIIQNAIRVLHFGLGHGNSSAAVAAENGKVSSLEADSVLGLEAFERCVFVMSVLEGYAEEQCALLLGCSHWEVRKARTRALQRIADSIRTASSH